MAGRPEQTDGQTPPIEEATLFVSADTTPENSAEEETLSEGIVRRIDSAFESTGLTGVGEDYRKQSLPDGQKERRFVSRGVGAGNVDYTIIDYKGSIVAGSFSLGFLAHDDVIDSAGATYHVEEGVIEGKKALELIDQLFPTVFPQRADLPQE